MKLKIGAHVITVEYRELENSTGLCDTQRGVITIDPTYPPSVQGASLIHEILHVINPTLGDTDHALMDSLSEQLFQVLHDNNLLNERNLHRKHRKST